MSEYVKERVLALRRENPGEYGNISCLRTNAQKYLVHYFRKGQLTKLFFLFPASKQKPHLVSHGACLVHCRPISRFTERCLFYLYCFARFIFDAAAVLALPFCQSRDCQTGYETVHVNGCRTHTSRRRRTGGASSAGRSWPTTHTCWRQVACCTPLQMSQSWEPGCAKRC